MTLELQMTKNQAKETVMPIINPQLDLFFERIVPVEPGDIWRCWTTPEHLMPWFTPAPWKTIACTIDLVPGGIFSTTMLSPEGIEFPNRGCYLEILPSRLLVWTNALEPGFRPSTLMSETPCDGFAFTAIITLQPVDGGTKYTAIVQHASETGKLQHQAMGFEHGWGKALDQLVAFIQST
jgi:uncharacterized protein YndB with AHSA1/START domain